MVTVIVTFLVVIDISAVNVAFPSIQDDLGTDRATLSWMISAYNVTVGALLLPSGRLADSLGRRRVFMPGVGLFLAGSLLCGLAPSVWVLITARVVQGAGGAVVFAASFAVMLPEFPPSRRSTAIGFAGATGALGAVVGPALGSVLIELFGWRSIFLINVPLGLLVLALAPRFLRESRDPDATGKIDLLGVLLGTTGVAARMFGIVESEKWGLDDGRVWALVAVGAVLVGALVKRSRHHPEPVLDLALFSYRSFSATCAGIVFYGFAFTSGALVNSIALQDLWDQPLSTVGLAFVPGRCWPPSSVRCRGVLPTGWAIAGCSAPGVSCAPPGQPRTLFARRPTPSAYPSPSPCWPRAWMPPICPPIAGHGPGSQRASPSPEWW